MRLIDMALSTSCEILKIGGKYIWYENMERKMPTADWEIGYTGTGTTIETKHHNVRSFGNALKGEGHFEASEYTTCVSGDEKQCQKGVAILVRKI